MRLNVGNIYILCRNNDSYMKVLIPEWHINKSRSSKYRTQHKPLTNYCDLHILYGGEETEIDWCKIHGVSNFYPSWNQKLENLVEVANHLGTLLGDFDILYTRNGGGSRMLFDHLLGRACNAKTVMKLGGFGSESIQHYKTEGNMKQTNWRMQFEGVVYRMYDYIHPLSGNYVDRMDTSGVNFTDVLPLGVDKNTEIGVDLGEVVFGYAGRHAPEKATQFLGDVVGKSDVSFKSVGVYEAPFYPPKTWNYHGVLQHEEMSNFYNMISVGVLPSYTEVCPNFILECYMHGRPVVVSENALPPEIPLFGWKVDGYEVHDWVETFKQVENPYQLGLEAQQYMMENWDSWDNYSEKLVNIFNKVLES